MCVCAVPCRAMPTLCDCSVVCQLLCAALTLGGLRRHERVIVKLLSHGDGSEEVYRYALRMP